MSDAREVIAESIVEWRPQDRTPTFLANEIVGELERHVRDFGPLPLGEDCVVVPTSGDAFDAMVETFINGAFDRGHGSGHAAVKAGLRAALRSPDPGGGT